MSDENKTVTKWADPAMFTAEPITADEGPKVYLLSMTPDPLGTIAAACALYEGKVIRDLSEVTDEDRVRHFEQLQRTHLKAPFEFVQFHFLIEGVTRGFTHQMVRQRTATYVQESTRFAVKEDMPVGLPPWLAGTENPWGQKRDVERLPKEERQRLIWEDALVRVHAAYSALVETGMPAEDARGLLPTNLLTRIHYRTDLKSLIEHGGNRLCTQAQFEWRLVFAKIVEAIRAAEQPSTAPKVTMHFKNDTPNNSIQRIPVHMAGRIADVFRPICYLTGKCEFKADFDRKCKIRDRVGANYANGVSSKNWGTSHTDGRDPQNPRAIGAIFPAEWLLDPGAAR